MNIYRIRKLVISEDKESLTTYIADVVAKRREDAMAAAQNERVSNWRLSTVLADRSVNELTDLGPIYQHIGKIDEDASVNPQEPGTDESSLTEKQKRMKEAVEAMQHYMNTYDKQYGYLDYEDSTFIEDMLYGIGTALEPEKYTYAQGFRKFKIRLAKDHIQPLIGSVDDLEKTDENPS